MKTERTPGTQKGSPRPLRCDLLHFLQAGNQLLGEVFV